MTKRLNLNNYKLLGKDNQNEASLVIVPFDVDGTKQPLMYLKNKLKPVPSVVDTDGATWIPTVFISMSGTPEEYSKRINWWFNNATSEFKQQLKATYRNLKNYDTEVTRAKTWLLQEAAYKISSTGKYIKRKKDIGRFLKNWLNRSLEYQDRRAR